MTVDALLQRKEFDEALLQWNDNITKTLSDALEITKEFQLRCNDIIFAIDQDGVMKMSNVKIFESQKSLTYAKQQHVKSW